MIMTADVLVQEGMNRITVLGVLALLEEDLIDVDEELLSRGPNCALAHTAKAIVSKITRVIDLYHTNRSFVNKPNPRAI
jgi:hypothetical protein